MINNEKNDPKEKKKAEDSGVKDHVGVKVESHILIKDVDTNKVLVNKRG